MSASTTRALVVDQNEPPVARIFMTNEQLQVADPVQFSDILSSDREDDYSETPLTASWDISGPEPLHEVGGGFGLGFDAPGDYTVTLHVTDSTGLSSTATKTFTVLPLGSLPGSPPTASFTHPDQFISAGTPETFDASPSSDPDGGALTYTWYFGDRGSATGAVVQHRFARVGDYPVVLVVTDPDGRSSATWEWDMVVGVESSFSVTPLLPVAGQPIVFDGLASWNSDLGATSYAWSFGDGATSSDATATHAYASAGTYVVRLTVGNDAGQSDTREQAVIVAPVAAPAAAPSPAATTVPTTTTVTEPPPAAPPAAPPTVPLRRLTGTSRADRLVGGAGSDVIRGGAGNDVIVGGAGRDTLSGGAGNDRIYAVDGAVDTISCGPGRDVVFADRIDRVARDCEVVHRSD
jgi:PKD repeat protein